MKLDADLFREILLLIENNPPGQTLIDPKIVGYDNETIGEHIEYLIDANYIKAYVEKIHNKYIHISIDRLTFDGQEFIKVSKDKTLWNSAKDKVIKTTSSLSINLLYEYLKNELKSRLLSP